MSSRIEEIPDRVNSEFILPRFKVGATGEGEEGAVPNGLRSRLLYRHTVDLPVPRELAEVTKGLSKEGGEA